MFVTTARYEAALARAETAERLLAVERTRTDEARERADAMLRLARDLLAGPLSRVVPATAAPAAPAAPAAAPPAPTEPVLPAAVVAAAERTAFKNPAQHRRNLTLAGRWAAADVAPEEIVRRLIDGARPPARDED